MLCWNYYSLLKFYSAYYGNINFFGGKSELCAKSSNKLLQIEKENEDAMLVLISDVWLDEVIYLLLNFTISKRTNTLTFSTLCFQDTVIKKLETMFIGFQEAPPTCFIFCGNFVSEPYGAGHASALKNGLKQLQNILLRFPTICEMLVTVTDVL